MKKYENLFQIGQVAVLCGITRKMILNYEDLGLVVPALVDDNSGYRYYDIMVIARIQSILELRRVGMSLPEIGRYLNGELTAENQVAVLEEQKRRLDFMITEMKMRTVKHKEYRIEEITLPEAVCLRTEYVASGVEDAIAACATAYGNCSTRGIPFAVAAYHFCEFPEDVMADDFFKTENIPMRICISIDPAQAPLDAVIYPECRALSLVYRGAYENSYDAYERLKEHILGNGYKVCGYPREIYLQGDFDAAFDDNIVQIVIPVKQE